MKKFGIEITKGNEEILVDTFDDKDEAMAFGADYFKTMKREDGVLTCFEGEFDELGNRVGDEERVCHVWY